MIESVLQLGKKQFMYEHREAFLVMLPAMNVVLLVGFSLKVYISKRGKTQYQENGNENKEVSVLNC
jgi:hypothetical protein